MPAKKAAKKAAKKRAKKPTPKKGELVAVVTPPVTDPDQVIEERLALVERWRTAWELERADVPYSAIAAQLNVSKTTAHRYVQSYQEYRGASPSIEAEREYQLAGTAFLEGKVVREATKGDISWAVASQAIRGLYSDRRDILGFDQAEPAQTGPIGVVGDDGTVEMPAAIAAILEA